MDDWLNYKECRNASIVAEEWEHVLLTYIKTVHEETPSYSFIIHYYDDDLEEFHQLEIDLNG